MDATKPRLGRGLDALLGGVGQPGDSTPTSSVPIEQIQQNPYQPRKRFDEDELKQLTESVKVHGILQPLVVRNAGDHFQLIAGERRLRAAQAAGLNTVPVHVVAFNDQQVYEAALVENIQRSDLNPIEKASGFKDYLDRFKMTHDQLGAKLGIDRSSVSNLVGLLNLAPEVQDAVRLGQISLGHAKILKGLTDQARQSALCKEIIMKSLSVHALDQLIKQQNAEAGIVPSAKAQKNAAEKVEKTAHVQSLEEDLKRRFATRVEVKLKAQEKGQIVINFETNDDFERIMQVLRT
jgi:ParB family transcriptional regulator, chromosome partitioning protein